LRHIPKEIPLDSATKVRSITLVEIYRSFIITLKPKGVKPADIEECIESMRSNPLNQKKLFQINYFWFGKEFSNWKSLCNQHWLSLSYLRWPWNAFTRSFKTRILMASSKRWIAQKKWISTKLIQAFVSSVAHKRNIMSKKSLNLPNTAEVYELHGWRYFVIA